VISMDKEEQIREISEMLRKDHLLFKSVKKYIEAARGVVIGD